VRENIEREVVLEVPGFLGLGAIIESTDLIATLPRHIGETLAKVNDLAVHPCPVRVDRFAVQQHWHARYHHEAGTVGCAVWSCSCFAARVDHGSPEPNLAYQVGANDRCARASPRSAYSIAAVP
jgi:hypothetical protein